MKPAFISGLSLLLLAGCQTVKVKQKHGVEWAPDENGHLNFTTYVTPEEYERMTKDERAHEHAAIAVEAATGWSWGKDKSPASQSTGARTLTAGELDKALAAEPARK